MPVDSYHALRHAAERLRPVAPMTGRDVDALVRALTLEEKALLTAGADMWSTVAVERLGIPKVNVTDGPSGARGPVLPGSGGPTSTCVPCGSALGATWDPGLVERVGAMIGEEARTKTCRVLLAPTVNIHRSPLAGRNFECYSEDPLLSGRLAAAFVRGVQSRGSRDHRQALRGQRRRVRAHDGQLRDRRASAARDHPPPVRARGARRRRPRDHDRVQPAQRCVLLRARGAARAHPARGVGLRRLRPHRLVRGRLDRGRGRAPASTSRCPARDGSTGPFWATRWRAARSTRRGSTAPSARCSPCSTVSTRSTTRPPTRPVPGPRPSTARSTVHWRAKPRPRRSCC